MVENVKQVMERLMQKTREAYRLDEEESPEALASETSPIIDLGKPARYEMDLADFPWVRFGRPRRAKTKIELYLFTDVIKGPDGSPVERIWKAYPHIEFGFPSESIQRLFVVLLEIWAEDAFLGDRINFSRSAIFTIA